MGYQLQKVAATIELRKKVIKRVGNLKGNLSFAR